MANAPTFSVTTPIFYVNDAPHIGHAYTEVAVDVLARWNRQCGVETWSLTGTDEHGQKILRTAVANDVTPKEWADKLVADAWIPLLQTIDIANDDFIRTTEERHESVVQAFLQKLYDDDYIYFGEYEGYYCVGCEEYKQTDDLLLGSGEFEGQYVCPIHGRPVEVLKEANYFFRMSAFGERLLELYESQPDFIQPDSLRNEIVSFVRRGLDDLSISRQSFDWGVRVPWDDKHVFYVWFDALINYISALGWRADEPGELFQKFWPSNHIVGKDIARFHAVIWPAMLMAAGLPTPRRVFGHGWLLVGGEKMSKSKLTGIAPAQITDVFGSDAFRYYFLRAISFGQDGSFSWEDLAARYQAELANGFGNLASRVVAMVGRYCDGRLPAAGKLDEADARIQQVVEAAVERATAAMERFAIHEAIAAIWTIVDELNGYLTEQEPWKVAKDESRTERLHTILATAAEGLRALSVLLAPVMPQSTGLLWTALGAEAAIGPLAEQRIDRVAEWGQLPAGAEMSTLPPLFPRIEAEQLG